MPLKTDQLQKIVGVVTWESASREVALTNSLRNFAKSEFSAENIRFLTDKGGPEDLYNKYLGKKASQQINLPGAITNRIFELGEAGDFKNKEWPNLIKAARKNIIDLLTRDTIPRYCMSKAFKIYCEQNADFKGYCLQQVQKPAKVLGVKNVKLLAQVVSALFLGDMGEAEKLTKKLEAEEKLREVLKALKAAGLN